MREKFNPKKAIYLTSMTEGMIIALLTAVISITATLFTSIVTTISNSHIENRNTRLKDRIETRERNLKDVYLPLIKILNSYPILSPNDIMIRFPNTPNYSSENLETILSRFEFQIEDFENQFLNQNLKKNKNKLTIEISDRRYAYNKIMLNQSNYNDAKEFHSNFFEHQIQILDLYASQNFRNALTEYEVTVHNVFIAGRLSCAEDLITKNILRNSKKVLINNMRADIDLNAQLIQSLHLQKLRSYNKYSY